MTRSAAVYGRLLIAYPRDFRREFGDEMIRVAQDRQVHGAEPLWRLWPRLLVDTAANAARARWHVVVTRYRAMAIGALLTLALLALLSDGVTGVPVAAVAGALAGACWRRRPSDASLAPPSSRAWFIAGAVLLGSAITTLVIAGDHEMAEWQWAWMFFSLLFGAFASITGAFLRLGPARLKE